MAPAPGVSCITFMPDAHHIQQWGVFNTEYDFFLLLRKIQIILEAIGVVGRREYECGDVGLTRPHVVRY